ncbi:zinc-dependent metalloprotease [Sphingomonas flavalba]|uniref:zinc-dependent metalloprotease n=1 Tax=Sphingomonas flavalba TaxID=2559804 RepID=UPI00109DE948|nr:zinc-dependent metalloprotease [Sphingomonas flavalba]
MSHPPFIALVLALALAGPAPAAAAPAPASAVTRLDGLLPVTVDRKDGRILISLPAPDKDGIAGRFIYANALRTGLGSATIMLDRGANSGSRLLVFRRIGNRVAAEFENPRFRAAGAPAAERDAARASFAYSTVWIGKVDSETAGGGFTVDIAPMLATDTMGIADALNGAEKGYALNPALSAVDPASVKVFPDNIEIEARQTYTSATPGAETRAIAPVEGNVSFVVRHSFVRLPPAGYTPLRFDPRGGSFATQIVDYGTPLGAPVVYELANRFRLEKIDPAAARSPVRKPIIFYIDRAAPEPIRTALAEGTRWWADAFDKAGFVDAFKVEILPEGVDPLDLRYNIVNWVNRATRGWSYGQAVTDPRTGEIIKGNVMLGSLRVRQDMLIFEGLVGADKVGSGGPNDPVQVALARIRQLAAHEVGHALGLAHNFAASTQGRYSVMDYPAPRIALNDGAPDLSDAYGAGAGRWDDYAIDWLYASASDEAARATALAGVREGLRYATDGDARAPETGQPWGSLWDDGADPAAELDRMAGVRRAALAHFGVGALAANEPVANLRRKFVPIWLLDRYQIEAAGKLLGGVDFAYAVAGDGREQAEPVAAALQRHALDSLLATLAASALDVPEGLVPMLSAGWSGENDRQFDIEIFRTAGGPVFDPLAAAEAKAAQTLMVLLAPERLARLAVQQRRNPALPGADTLVDRLIAATFDARNGGRLAAVRRRTATTAALALARVARDPKLAPDLAVAIDDRLQRLAEALAKRPGDAAEQGWARGLSRLLADREALDKAVADKARAPNVPPGMPIGAESDWMAFDGGDD